MRKIATFVGSEGKSISARFSALALWRRRGFESGTPCSVIPKKVFTVLLSFREWRLAKKPEPPWRLCYVDRCFD